MKKNKKNKQGEKKKQKEGKLRKQKHSHTHTERQKKQMGRGTEKRGRSVRGPPCTRPFFFYGRRGGFGVKIFLFLTSPLGGCPETPFFVVFCVAEDHAFWGSSLVKLQVSLWSTPWSVYGPHFWRICCQKCGP